ncbi:multidrug transporter MurJ [Methyloceanibacter superfactus]|jgi:putative peptidoglycan lipid II flippase|uniref:Probable lipid II flippase MurJ n=1 Tax=Methyloceanibacter superfactus TaxID=1774969 RepID=A0A1E3W842_9HYPH|nr:murein biosynthesis integral membrane protein MurJ [Methyloceanibacter superfactus]ODS01946.1 multidrug transporter MurJ [Methyloceanibacter superfactus]
MKLYRGFATVGGMTVISRVLGFVRDMLIAAVLGASSITDAFFVGFRVPNMFRRIFAEGAFNAAFIPLFTKKLHAQGDAAARDFAALALSGLTLVLFAFVILAEIAMPWLMLLLAPGFAEDPDKFRLAVLLGRIALPYLVFMSWVALYTGLLNTLGRFAAAAFAPSLLNVVLILVLLGLVATGTGEQTIAGVALAWGVVVSGLLQVAVVAFAAIRAGLRLKLERPRFTPDMKRLLQLAVPGMIAGGMAQITIVISTIIASLQDRVVSWLYYADRIFQLPLGLIGVAVGVVLLPDLSHKLRTGDHRAVIDSENRALEFSLLLTVPAAVALFIASWPIMRVLFERGAFTTVDARATAGMLSALAIGLPAYVLIKALQPSFFAREDTKTPMIYAGIAMAANAALSYALFVILGAVGIAIATSLTGWINVVLLAAELRRRGEFELDDQFRRAFVGIVLASLAMGAVLWGLTAWLDPWFTPDRGLLVQIFALAGLIGVGLGTYLVVGAFAGALKPRTLLKDLLGR